MVTETVAFHGEPYFSREFSGLNGYRQSLDMMLLGVATGLQGHGQSPHLHSGTGG
jgi:hypothetical protein